MTERSEPEAAARLVVFGGGNMGAALVGGLLRTAWAPAGTLAIVEPLASRRAQLAVDLPGVPVGAEPPESAEGVVVAVKPNDVPAACRAAGTLGASRVLSIAAGVPTSVLEAVLGGGTPVVRAMPNTPALVGAGASAISPGAAATDNDLTWAESILSAVGTVVRVPEHLLDAVTGLSGSGPAYVFLVAEALADAGVAAGLPRATAVQLVEQLLVGSAKLLAESGEHPAKLRADVTSPGGTTAAGLRELERAGVRAAFLECVLAATRRSKELGGT
jgi:pyrroline-5-carboxylate reductase